ncbi:helix-turn-helix transcriptional regulator [Anaerotignum sp.]|uniref:helix-turn-helix transcriptional regulator n=1 Tax=Anaerotignum sp. TaxID=2039241 RepID=UPI00289CAFCC|nr:helix-turn-helix domain-containing protein [Anaerotignum sp.]
MRRIIFKTSIFSLTILLESSIINTEVIVLLSEKLKNIREKKNYSKAEMARLLQIPYTTYNNYETGTREPKIETIIKIANILGIHLSDILDYEPISSDELYEVMDSSDIETAKMLLKCVSYSLRKKTATLYEITSDFDTKSFLVDKFDLVSLTDSTTGYLYRLVEEMEKRSKDTNTLHKYPDNLP